jgi:hypothetical protein
MEKNTVGWRTLRYVGLHDLHSSPNIIRVVESRTMKGAGHAACTGGKEECISDGCGEAGRKEATWNS